jgi:hypothetical protein
MLNNEVQQAVRRNRIYTRCSLLLRPVVKRIIAAENINLLGNNEAALIRCSFGVR